MSRNALQSQISPREAVELGAVDSLFYSAYFFPKTFRQASPPFHVDIWTALEGPGRYVDIEVFRGGSKTTLTRTYTSKRIAYGISHTILFVSDTLGHSVRSVKWLMRAVEYNTLWADTFQLRRGSKWTGEEIEIIHGIDEYPITVVAAGIEGQIRGLNIDDYRPDLIVVDDPCDEDNTGTPERRDKTSKLFFGALEKSLAPSSECPEAKMVLLQTSLAEGDLINMCHVSSQWDSRKYSCFDEQGNSRWEARFPTKELLEQKQAHVERNQLSLWMREMECTLVADEMSYFRSEWLNYWEVLPEHARYYIVIDPTPQQSEKALAKNLDTDYQVASVVCFFQGKMFAVEYHETRNEDDDDLVLKIVWMCRRYPIIRILVEGIAYQRRLKALLEKEMRKRRVFVEVTSIEDKRNKRVKIRQGLAGRASMGNFYVRQEHTTLIAQFIAYPQVAHEDVLETMAIASDHAENDADGMLYEGEFEQIEDDIEDLPDTWRLLN